MLRIRTPQHTKSVTCDRNLKANPYKWKFINSKETGNQEPARTDGSHKDQLPMIRNKEGQRGKLVSTVEQNHHIPKVSVLQRRQSASSVGRKGIMVPCANQRVKMHMLMSYKSSLQQLLSAWTAY